MLKSRKNSNLFHKVLWALFDFRTNRTQSNVLNMSGAVAYVVEVFSRAYVYPLMHFPF